MQIRSRFIVNKSVMFQRMELLYIAINQGPVKSKFGWGIPIPPRIFVEEGTNPSKFFKLYSHKKTLSAKGFGQMLPSLAIVSVFYILKSGFVS